MMDPVHELTRELQAMAALGDFDVTISAVDAFSLIACLQLAYRHPRLSDSQKRIIGGFAMRLGKAFEGYPVARDIISRGWTE